MGVLRSITDGLTSLLTGAGTTVDRRMSGFYALQVMDPQQIEARYRSSWLARKIIDIPPYDMTREGRDWQAEAPQIEALEAEEKRHDVWGKLRHALILGRLGGGAIVIGAGTEDAALPLNLRALAKGGLRYLHVFSRWQLSIGAIVTDPQSDLCGQPEYFQISGRGTMARIHPSRVIPFKGMMVPKLQTASDVDCFWGDSVLQAVDDAVKNADLAQNGFASLIDEAKIDVYGIPDFLSNIGSAEYEGQFRTRMDLMNVSKSTHRAVFKDAAETWETRQITWTGMPEIVRTYLSIVAGAADIPATRLLGKAPDGMNATGEGDEKNYLQSIKARQASDLGAALDRLDEVLIRSAIGSRPREIHYAFAPLFMMDEKEQATIAKTKAETVKIYADTGTVPIDALAKAAQNQLIEDGTFSGLEAALEESEAAEADDDGTDPSELQAANENEVAELQRRGAITGDQAQALLTDARPRTLYVSRKLLNGAEFVKWAKAQGFETTAPADELHVTIAFSRRPVDWMKMGQDGIDWDGTRSGKMTVAPGGPRVVEPLGDKGAVVLLFSSTQLQWRHEDMKRNGASHDFDEYQPHVTITYFGGDVDLSEVEPYRGKLEFGPEIFAEVEDDWEKGLVEA